jgi:pentatricopeptide repeat protein
MTTNRRRKITKFNSILTRFILAEKESGLKQKAVQSLYKAYHSTRLALAQNWSDVPPALWQVLWRAFSSAKDSSNRLSRIAALARDMSDARATFEPTQQILAIEAVFVDGWESKAIENWRRCMSTLGTETSETFKDFWELGARMYCRVGDLGQAERAINKLLGRNMSPRILLPLIRTCCEQGTEEGKQKAWTAYRQMRELLGKSMGLSDYDQVISYFLTAHQVENALYAFVDMMSDGRIDMTKQKHMPSVIANKFFLGKWLKRLIGAGDLNGAFSVVEFMRERGVEAAPIQLNGLIGAWQRSGGADDLEKADTLAWQMVESRLEFVAHRQSHSDLSSSNDISSSETTTMNRPRATIETFSLLAENYRLRNLHGRLEDLWDAFRKAKISPDAFMMNQLLESLIQEGQPQEALALYHSFIENSKVVPDPYTFTALWKTLGVSRYHIRDTETQTKEVEATRAMFKETVKHRDVFQPDGIDGQLARKILHSFRRLQDNAGFLVAITAFKETFQFLPPETLVMEMVLGTTKLSWDTPSQRGKLMQAKREIDRDLLAWADSNAASLEGDENRGAALYAFLQKKFWPAEGNEEEKRKIFVEVARQMGVYELLGPKKDAGGR